MHSLYLPWNTTGTAVPLINVKTISLNSKPMIAKDNKLEIE